MAVELNDFKRKAECTYKGEQYSVRDNGAVFRHARKDKPLRKYDNKWTFGTPRKDAYLYIASEVIHRIVAYAFLGEPPTPQHIVDHIDTNRQNNRPENLRWVTKLENALNPITVNRIIFHCGSIEAFLKDPSILKNYVNENPNFNWMRSVTPMEAQISWEHVINWARKENKSTSSKGGSMGEWIYQEKPDPSSSHEISDPIASKTPNAVQKNWKTPSEFPCCPQESTDNSIAAYFANLKVEKIFSRNQYSDSIISDFAIAKDENTIWVLCMSSDTNAIKPWSLAQVTYENDLFVHTNLGSFFTKEGADKHFTLAQGLEWTGGETFDDFA